MFTKKIISLHISLISVALICISSAASAITTPRGYTLMNQTTIIPNVINITPSQTYHRKAGWALYAAPHSTLTFRRKSDPTSAILRLTIKTTRIQVLSKNLSRIDLTKGQLLSDGNYILPQINKVALYFVPSQPQTIIALALPNSSLK